jgi:hypothetical protein
MTSPTSHSHHVFVDFENVPSVDLALIGGLPVFVTLLIGKTQTKLDTTLVEQIHAHAAKVRLITLGASGRNALDLTLAYYLGRAAAETTGAELHIVSKDKDFEPLIAHLRSKNLKVSRADSFAALPFLAASKPPAPTRKAAATPRKPQAATARKPADDRAAKVVARLKNPSNRNRPSSEGALLAHIRTALGKEVSEQKVDDVLRQLRDEGVLTIEPNGRVSYLTGP